MAVVGIDLGTYTSYIAVARQGGIETVANEYSDRCTPTYVSMEENNRVLGVAARLKNISNFRNTISGFKRVLGRKFNDPQVQKELEMQLAANEVTQDEAGNVLFQMSYMGDVQQFTPEQIAGMMFTKLKHTAEAALKTKVVDVVVSVPSFYTDAERRALVDSIQVAGLNCLRILNDTTAAGLAYGIYKPDLPAETEKPRNVVIIDFGYSALQLAAISFQKGKLKVLGTAFDTALGGRDFDEVLMRHFLKEFETKHKVDLLPRHKPRLRMLQECEKLKKLMSANAEPIPINIECLYEERDFHSNLDRARFEEMVAPYIKRIESTFRELLETTKIRVDDIHSVEIVGGSSRLPAFKGLVKTVFGKEPSTTLNADEAVARGCALMCAILSPTFRVRDFSITDCQPFPITLNWQAIMNEDSSLEVFTKFHVAPFSKMLTFYRKEPFELKASYTYPNDIPYPTTDIGTFKINNVKPTASGESSKVKVKVRINKNGIFSVTQATMYETVEKGEEEQPEAMEVDETKRNGETDGQAPEPMQTDQGEKAAAGTDSTESQDASQETPPEEAKQDGEKKAEDKKSGDKKKTKVKSIDLPIEERVPQLPKDVLLSLVEKESKMVMQDKLEKERMDSKNAVEEYLYEMREKIFGALEEFVKDEDREKFSAVINEVEDWLYGDGESQSKQVYIDKLSDLKKMGQPIVDRHREAQERPQAFEDLGATIQKVRKFLDAWHAQDEKLDHISKEDVEKVMKCVQEKFDWFEKHQNLSSTLKPFENPPVLASQISQQRQNLESTCSPIMNKPKPKVEPPKENKKEGEKEKAGGDSSKKAPAQEHQENSVDATPKADMDVD